MILVLFLCESRKVHRKGDFTAFPQTESSISLACHRVVSSHLHGCSYRTITRTHMPLSRGIKCRFCPPSSRRLGERSTELSHEIPPLIISGGATVRWHSSPTFIRMELVRWTARRDGETERPVESFLPTPPCLNVMLPKGTKARWGGESEAGGG